MLLSIIIPVYNASNTLKRCLDSILASDYSNYEVICVNDGSTDDSLNILQNYSNQYSQIKIISADNQGAYMSRQRGVLEAKGTWIGFVDSDDEIASNMFSIMMNRIEDNECVDMVVCAFEKVTTDGKVFDVQMDIYGDATYSFIDSSEEKGVLTAVNPAYWNKIVRKSIAERALKLNYSPKIMEDYLFFASVLPYIKGVSFISKPLYKYYNQTESVTKRIGRTELETAESGLLDLRSHLMNLKEYYENDYNKALIDVMACIHLGIAFTINYNFWCVDESIESVWKQTKFFLDNNYPKWENNEYLKLTYVIKHKQLIKAYTACKLYGYKIWPFMVRCYHMFCNIIGRDLKW